VKLERVKGIEPSS